MQIFDVSTLLQGIIHEILTFKKIILCNEMIRFYLIELTENMLVFHTFHRIANIYSNEEGMMMKVDQSQNWPYWGKKEEMKRNEME